MTEQQALLQLGAKDWRSLSKNQIMKFFFETAPNLSDEVRLKILESAPYILNTVQSVVAEYQTIAQKTLENNQEVVDKILNHNHDIARVLLTNYHESTEILRGLLSDPTTPFEQKQYWNTELGKILREMRDYDKVNKQYYNELDQKHKSFLRTVMKYRGYVALLCLSVGLVALTGGKLKLPGK